MKRTTVIAFAAACLSVAAMGISLVGCDKTTSVVVTPPAKVEHRRGGTQIVIPINPRYDGRRHNRRHW